MGFRACAPHCVSAAAWLEKKPKSWKDPWVRALFLSGWSRPGCSRWNFGTSCLILFIARGKGCLTCKRWGGGKEFFLKKKETATGHTPQRPAKGVTVVGRGPRVTHGTAGDNPNARCSRGSCSKDLLLPARLLTTNCRLRGFFGRFMVPHQETTSPSRWERRFTG